MKKKAENKEKLILDGLLDYIPLDYILKNLETRIDAEIFWWECEVDNKEYDLGCRPDSKQIIGKEIKNCKKRIKVLNKANKLLKKMRSLFKQENIVEL